MRPGDNQMKKSTSKVRAAKRMSVLPYYDVMINTAASCSNINNNDNDDDGGDDGRIMT